MPTSHCQLPHSTHRASKTHFLGNRAALEWLWLVRGGPFSVSLAQAGLPSPPWLTQRSRS